jgi:hypothetical protein
MVQKVTVTRHRIRSVVADEQRSIGCNGHTHRASLDLTIPKHKTRKEILVQRLERSQGMVKPPPEHYLLPNVFLENQKARDSLSHRLYHAIRERIRSACSV